MSWTQISIITSACHVDVFSDLLMQAGALSVTYTDAADEALYEPPPGETPLWTNTKIIALFDRQQLSEPIVSTLKSQCGNDIRFQFQCEVLADQEWETSWKDHFKAMRFGKRLWVCPSDVYPDDAEAIRLELNPGLAFGTGTHPTTSMCLETLAEQDLNGLDVLDFGCGSGILSIACAKLGARQVRAVDIDPQAILATQNNSKMNAVEHLVHPVDVKEIQPGSIDILVANILFNPLKCLAPDFVRYLKSGGRIVLSGILEHQAMLLKKTYSPWIDWDATLNRDSWVCMVGKRL